MSLPRIARDLYRLYREVDRLEKRLDQSSGVDREQKKHELAERTRERDQMRKILDGHLDR
jgi:hypothetical protein